MAEERACKLVKTHDEASSSSSSAAASGSEYEVFLSFRGDDIRQTFADHLYWNLTGAGIRTFRDNEGLLVGKEIGGDLLKAIEKSSISIPIFSKGYASSKWCLMELTQMVKCMNRNDGRHTICPIFYDVTPSNVKHQTGSYEEAFLRYTENGGPIVEEWKDALKQVAELKGWEKDKVKGGNEGELIKIIGTEVCRMLKKSHVSLTDRLVGMDHHLKKMEQLLDLNCDDVRVIGIHGMGGSGKTTIAKYVYNQLCDHFQQQCAFLEDVKENVVRKSSAELQKQLISAVLKRTVNDIVVDINTLRDKKVLIVLDDVEERSQLDEIIQSRYCFGSGSRILVTSRNQDVFVECERDLIYRPTGMNDDESLLLFCKHAFESTKPSEGYEGISRQLAQSAAGLPLSLVVIGSMLYKKNKKIWEETLKKLRVIPREKIFERLKISYDALNYGQRQIFLDIACHFIGEDKRLPFYMWEDCEFFPEGGIDTLVSLSLITIEKELFGNEDCEVFRMHDQLRDLGRYIVNQESDVGKRSRLWSHEKAEEVLNNRWGTETVETFYMKSGQVSDCICISNDDRKGLSRLRYLHLGSSTLNGDFKGLVSNLRWFTAPLHSGKKSRMRATNFCANKLVILDLSNSEISDGWESWIQINAATNLKVLNLSSCRSLTKLPECLWNMKSLVELDISYTGITKLSDQGIGNLTNLTKLLLTNSEIKRLPGAIGKQEKLRVLDCSACWSLKGEVPSGIGSNLRKLNLSCTYIKKLPGVVIERLRELEELDCMWCMSLEGPLPEGIWSLSSLRVLNFSRCYKITGGLPKDISGMSRLENLDLEFCENLRFPAEGLKLPLSLTRIVIPFTKATLDSIKSLVNLRELEFYKSNGPCCDPHPNNNNNDTPSLPIIDMPSNLEVLKLRLWGWKHLSCRLLSAMKFDSSSRLDMLEIEGFEGLLLSGLPDLSNCQMLRGLVINRCNKLREIADFGKLGSSWVFINIWNCGSLEVLSNLSTMKRLKNLTITCYYKLREIKGLEVLTSSLEGLTIRYCPLLKLHPDLLNSENLNIRFEYQATWAICISICLEIAEIFLEITQRMFLNRIGVSFLLGLGFLYIIQLILFYSN